MHAQAVADVKPASSSTGPAAAAQPTMTLEECIAYALANNFDIKIQAFSTLAAKESLLQSNADYDPSLTGCHPSQHTSISSNASSQLEGASDPTSEARDWQHRCHAKNRLRRECQPFLEYSQSLPDQQSLRHDQSAIHERPVPGGQSTSALAASVPPSTKRPSNGIKIGVDRANLDYKGQILDTVRDVENAYVNLVSAREALEVRRFSLQLAQNLYDENVVRKDNGVLTDLDVLTAEVGVCERAQQHGARRANRARTAPTPCGISSAWRNSIRPSSPRLWPSRRKPCPRSRAPSNSHWTTRRLPIDARFLQQLELDVKTGQEQPAALAQPRWLRWLQRPRRRFE